MAATGSHLLLEHPGAETLLVVCSAIRPRKAKGSFWYYKRTLGLAAHRLFVADHSRRYFQHGVAGLGSDLASTVAAILAIQQRLGAKRLVFLGHSMGGHGALLMGSLAKATLIVTFGTEVELLLPGSRSQRYIPRSARSSLKLDIRDDLSRSGTPILMLLGQSDPHDLMAAAHLAHLPHVRIHELIGCGHNCPAFLGADDAALLTLAVRGECWTAEKYRVGTLSRNAAAMALVRTAQSKELRGDFTGALHDWLAVKSLAPGDVHLHGHRAADCLFRLGRHQEAAAALAPAVAALTHVPTAPLLMGRICVALGRLDEAERHLLLAQSFRVTRAEAALVLTRMYLSQRRFGRACEVALRVCRTLLRRLFPATQWAD